MWPWLAPVVVLAVGAAVAVPLLGGSDDDPGTEAFGPPGEGGADADGGGSWLATAERPTTDKVITAWTAGDTVVRVAESGVTAFSQADGQVVWQAAPPDGQAFCGAGSRGVDGRAALAVGPGSVGNRIECDTATVLDLASGELGWRQPISAPRQGDHARNGAVLEIVGDTVVIAQDQGLVGLNLADGQRRWQREVSFEGEPGCGAEDMLATDTRVVLAQTCGRLRDQVQFAVVDPATGETARERTFAGTDPESGLLTPALLSADPLVGYVRGNHAAIGLVLDEEMEVVAEVELGDGSARGGVAQGDGGFGRALSETEHVPPPLRVIENALYAVTLPEGGAPNQLVAFDLATGERRWAAALPDAHATQPVTVEDGAVVVATGPRSGTGELGIARFDAATGEVLGTTGAPVVNDSGQVPAATTYRYFYQDGRMLAVRGAPGPNDPDAFGYGG
ncbi:outer membrane protein assembly factor BamB family protein [Streptomyces marincola]|uniref:outer membrane protein assembly factor BamB family protein n=1 Tax=Streptomyces marincola TaxID=2878388 RepID=UPI001CF3E77B|nr:PQQ-binding-like beta-propeller repeat protein [Streptomyces marincola]UCM88185.1 PQQ-binding-like beta-propeller repeat protein [Streptomyces marincola]